MCDKIMEISPINISSSWAGPNPEGHMQPLCAAAAARARTPRTCGSWGHDCHPFPRVSRDPEVLPAQRSPCKGLAKMGEGLGDNPRVAVTPSHQHSPGLRAGDNPRVAVTPPPAQVLPCGAGRAFSGFLPRVENRSGHRREAKSGRGQGEQLPGPCWKGRAPRGPEPPRAQPERPGLHCTARGWHEQRPEINLFV